MDTLSFRSVVKIRGINPFIAVAATRASAFKPGWRRPLPVLVRINGKPAGGWRTNMMPAGDGGFYLYLNGIVRTAAGASVGDQVNVAIEFDAGYRNGPQHPMPAWFRKVLQENQAAWKNWVLLIPSRKKEILRYFAQLQSADARARNAAKALYVLSGNKGRFMARTWTDGS